MAYEIAAGIMLAYIVYFIIELGASFAFKEDNPISNAPKIFGCILLAAGVIAGLSVLAKGLNLFG